jgi:cytochrome c553
MTRTALAGLLLLLLPVCAHAQGSAYDPDNAKDIMRVCAACHGEFGEGGGGGVYPRLAGLHKNYLSAQIRSFKKHQRENIPMIPYATERELPENEVLNISIYLSEIKLENRMPELDPKTDAFERLMVAKRVLQIPKMPGDISKGETIYRDECAVCHGKQGEGKGEKPPLSGQHTRYLRAQFDRYLRAEREHPDRDEIFKPHTDEDWRDLLAYLSILDD